jgi:UDP-N-acetylmuramyl pentapeptide phosphotransferase/UDP-N-acetylglucosamine-1-phosphate transferase
MLVEFISKVLSQHQIVLLIVGVISSYVVTAQSLPFIIYFSKRKKITARIEERSSHSSEVPNIGGLGIIAGIYITTLTLAFFILNYEESKTLIALFVALIILFFIGFKDDMLGLSAKAKLLTEVVTSAAFIILTEYRVDNFYGLFGIYEINYFLSISLSIFVFVIIINSFNLIDGIDGLASGFGIIALSCLLILSISINNVISLIICTTMIGSLIAFLKFNLSSDKRKIFMGDTGSLVIGFLISIIVLFALCSKNNYASQFSNLPVLILSILSFPFIDTIRVMFIRKKSGIKFFEADKNHIHHKLLEANFSHKMSSLIILGTYSTSIVFCLITSSLDITLHFFLCLFYSFISLFSLILFCEKRKK